MICSRLASSGSHRSARSRCRYRRQSLRENGTLCSIRRIPNFQELRSILRNHFSSTRACSSRQQPRSSFHLHPELKFRRFELIMTAMTQTMKAAVVEEFGKPLVLREWEMPKPGQGQIVLKTEACGVCHTDLHAAEGDWPLKPALPFIPGHEAIGVVTAVGAGVNFLKEGDRVGVPWLYSACGHCEYCITGWETVCAEAQYGGYTKNGGFAQYIVADPKYAARIPEG